MVFSSLLFLFCFFPIVLIVYFLCPRRGRNLVLFLSSLIFYAWGEPGYVVLMLFSTWQDYMLGARVDQCKEKGNMRGARRAVITSAVNNLSLLGVFRYSDFIIGNINTLTGLQLPLPQLALPIGISFYTFQTMSYTIDVYRGEVAAQKNILTFATYVTLFPQLIAGSIVQYKTVQKELMRSLIHISEPTRPY